MNISLLIGLIVGAVAVAVFHVAHRAVASTTDRIDRTTRRTLPGYCADCGGAELTRAGMCATCGSGAIWTPGSLDLPALAPKSNAKHAALAAKTRARFGSSVTESGVVN